MKVLPWDNKFSFNKFAFYGNTPVGKLNTWRVGYTRILCKFFISKGGSEIPWQRRIFLYLCIRQQLRTLWEVFSNFTTAKSHARWRIPYDISVKCFPASWNNFTQTFFNAGRGCCVIMTTKREFRSIYFPKSKTNAREYLPMFYKAITICHTIIDLWGTVRKSWPQSNCTQTPSPSKLHQPQG